MSLLLRTKEWWFCCLLFGAVSCIQSEYTDLVKDELAKNVRCDSIFLTFEFGDDRQEFYTKGWELNKKKLVVQGPQNRTVKYMMETSEKGESSIRMLFYPLFDANDKIKEMEVTFDYVAWAPWTSRFNADSLLVVLRDTLLNWYGGNHFIKVSRGQKANDYLWVKVDGNRRIVIHKNNEKDVYGRISDLTHPEVMEK